MKKIASIEETELRDPKTGKVIRISTTTRLVFRRLSEEFRRMRNFKLNALIAEDFIKNSNNVLHYFRLGNKKETRNEYSPPGSEPGKIYANVGEIRGKGSSYYISAIKDDSIDILTIQTKWLKPKYRGTKNKPIELGEEE